MDLTCSRTSPASAPTRRPTRIVSDSASYVERYDPLQEELASVTENRPPIRSSRTIAGESSAGEAYPSSSGFPRVALNRTSTFEGPTQLRQEQSPQWIQRTPSDNMSAQRNSTYFSSGRFPADPYADSEASSYGRSSPERNWGNRSSSPATSHGSVASRGPNPSTLNNTGLSKKGPPPPPPSRSKKPPPPPPPMKRTLLTSSNV